MAQELRHERLFGATDDGTTSEAADAEFRNDSSAMIHIRGIDYDHIYHTAGPNERGRVEISKAPTGQGQTNNSPFFMYGQAVGMDSAVALDSAQYFNGGKRWGRGQLTLEPNESLFVNVPFKSSGGTLQYGYVIEYEFAGV